MNEEERNGEEEAKNDEADQKQEKAERLTGAREKLAEELLEMLKQDVCESRTSIGDLTAVDAKLEDLTNMLGQIDAKLEDEKPVSKKGKSTPDKPEVSKPSDTLNTP